jgi:cytochrome c5
MRIPKETLIVVLLGVVLLAAVVFVATTDSLAQETTPKPKLVIPDEAKQMQNPVEATKESVDYGKLIFSSQCAMCHGKTGDGTGDLVGRLNLTMPDLSDAAELGKRTDGELFYIMTKGCQRMPAQEERLKDKVKWDLVNYIRTLPAGS